MKKLLLTTTAVLAISNAAFADMDKIYLRGDLLAHKFKNIEDKMIGSDLTLKSKFGLGVDFGVGTYVTDNMRAEIVYTHIFNPDHKYNGKIGLADIHIKSKAKANSIMLRGMFDFAEIGPGSVYVGAGLGWANVSTNYNVKIVGPFAKYELSEKSKNKNNLALSLHLGYGIDISDDVKADFGYSYRNFGKTNKVDNNSVSLPLSSHNLSAGIRFNI